jgi:hypothetical protein
VPDLRREEELPLHQSVIARLRARPPREGGRREEVIATTISDVMHNGRSFWAARCV